MKRKIRSMLSTALIVSMLGTMFSGTAFAAGIKKQRGYLRIMMCRMCFTQRIDLALIIFNA